MTSNTTPCSTFVLPVPKEIMIVNNANNSNTIDLASIPRVMVNPVKIETIATAGMVSPILARAEPSARLRLVCKRLFRADLSAAKPSGNRITNATITHTSDFGAPNYNTIFYCRP